MASMDPPDSFLADIQKRIGDFTVRKYEAEAKAAEEDHRRRKAEADTAEMTREYIALRIKQDRDLPGSN